MEKSVSLRGRDKAAKRLYTKGRDWSGFVLCFIGFFTGRVALFQFMNPIALAYLSSFLGSGSKLLSISFFTALGIVTRYEGLYTLKYLAAVILLYGMEVFYNISSIKPDKKVRAVTTAAVTLLCGLMFAFLYGGSTYFTFMAVLETVLVFSLSFILKSGTDIFEKLNFKEIYSNEILISTAIIMGAVVCGAADVYIGDISFKFLFSTIVILIIGYNGGASAGATTGVLLGFILTLTGFSNYSLLGILSISGMICGVMKDTGKLGSILGFLAGGLITSFYLDTGILNVSLLFSVLPAAIIFFFIPDKFQIGISSVYSPDALSQTYLDRVKEVTKERLMGFSEAFKNLGYTFSGISEKKIALDQKDVSKMIDDVAAKICTHCPNCTKCWEENFFSAYQMSFALMEICEKKGYIRLSELKDEHYHVCEYLETYADEINRAFDIYKNNLMWYNQIVESRELVSQQLLGISGVIMNLAGDLDFETGFNRHIEDRIMTEFRKEKIDVSSIMVLETQEGKYEVIVNRNNCHGRKACVKEMIPVLNTVLDRKMKKDDRECVLRKSGKGEEKCRISFSEEGRFHMASGIARAVKDGYSQSGDSYSIMDIKGGKCLLVLSDGMGSGRKAGKESKAAVEILEEFIETGFDKETAIKIINSVLVLKSLEDSFSTFDICSIDLYTGIAEFIKIGAVSSFIIRNGNVISIKSNSLPMGILNTVDAETTTKRLKDGDIIVMITDGLTEVPMVKDKDTWVQEALESFTGTNPQDIADYLLMKAREASREEIKDDMTVLAVRVWEGI